jgi:pimeloyl-ACP methyl ester carboxylesterase
MSVPSASSQVDQINATLTDASRADRVIDLDIRVPSDAMEAVPWVVFGHGFVMPTDDYDDLATALATSGYAVLLVETETGFAPSHEDFGLDLAYVVENAATDLSELDGVLGDHVALMGHSMGGGAAWLAAAQLGSEVDALIGLAPAETSPSAIAAGVDVVAPTMVISGSSDEVTSPSEHHEPIYASTLNAGCRAWVNLIDGGHCGFADAGTLCDFGEITFDGMPREEQQELSFAAVEAFLSYHLGTDALGMLNLEAMAIESASVELTLACDWTGVTEVPEVGLAAPNPASSRVHVPQFGLDGTWRAFDLHGRELPLRWLGAQELSVDGWPQGLVLLTWTSLRGGAVWRTSISVAR